MREKTIEETKYKKPWPLIDGTAVLLDLLKVPFEARLVSKSIVERNGDELNCTIIAIYT